MPNDNWKCLALLGGVAVLAVLLLVITFSGLLALSLSGWLLWGLLLGLTVVAGRFTVPVTDADGRGQSHKSIADALIFLAAMIYGSAPAAILAGIDGYNTSRRTAKPARLAFSVATAIASTVIAVFCYEIAAHILSAHAGASSIQDAPLEALLLPLCVLALVQYGLNTLATFVYSALESGQTSLRLVRESLVWTAITQMSGAGAAALFYYARQQQGRVSFLALGLLMVSLVYLLNRFNRQRVDELKRSEAEKLRHVQEIADLHMNTIESLAIAIDAKDQTTHGHVRRTQIYALELGKRLGVSETDLLALRAGALLHDIGKLAVPEYILNKPGKLTGAEFDKMKVHTVVGGDIVKRVGFPYPVEDIVRYHHEKWDGTGYPRGLRGEQIPMVARIISVVDFYDATRCDRPYRIGMKREDSLALLRRMANSSFDPRVVETFVSNIDFFDALIAEQDIQEQVQADTDSLMTTAGPDAGLAADVLGAPADDSAGFRSIVEAQREVFALHEIAQTIGSSLNLQDTVTLVASKLRAIVPFDTCTIYLVDERTGKAVAAHVAGQDAEAFAQRRVTLGEGITGWVIANARSMCNTPPELDLVGVPEEVTRQIKGVLVSPLVREDGAFGAITLYSKTRASYTTEQVRLLESVAQHAATALNNALTFERTKESALTDPLTDLPNARSFHLLLEQRLAECQRHGREPLTVLSMDLDDFKSVNDAYGHGVGDRLLANVAGVIKRQLRQMDILARYAGDEFVAIMPMASSDVATMIAERIRTAVEEQRFTVRTGRTAQVGISIGIACFPREGETVEALITAAGHNMQHDKYARRLSPQAAAGVVASIEAMR
ncbi:MAG TPA: diguanylate cyclase [Pyrinomonadaceae bacterium]|jgi:diguanylate cyclase (GGDEF)-like protein/putative nucleotidyltransferase with HDIG domain